MRDPYEVLGISKDATEEQIKSAYRNLARKYHPDNYADNPLSDLASEKMQEINDAYDTIMNQRKHRKNSGNNFNNVQSNYPDVRNLIASNRLEQAQELLDGVPTNQRDAEWYFLNGTVQYKRGWFDGAYASFSNACRLDPTNAEYREALNRMQRSRTNAYNPYRTAAYGAGCSGCDVCSSLICADCCCECMGGDLIRCC
ncbi:MAG: J domain-containing protein [Clostridia bacterium]|nr:J domain-containing protein [Clostridia bacterium]